MTENPLFGSSERQLSPPAARLVVAYMKVGIFLHDSLDKGELDKLLQSYQAPGNLRKSGSAIWQELQAKYPDLKKTLNDEAKSLGFDFDESGIAWSNITGAAMRYEGARSGYKYKDSEMKVIGDNAGKLTDKQISLLLPGRSEDGIAAVRQKLELPNIINEWSGEENDLLRRLVAQGLTDQRIADKMLTRTVSAVTTHRQRINLPKREWTEVDDTRLRELNKQKVTARSMANEFGVDVSTISRHLDALGIKRKPTEEQINEMKRMAKNGYSYSEIAGVVGFPDYTVLDRLQKLRITPNNLWQWEEKDTKTMLDGYEAGLIDKEIAIQLDRPLWQIKYYKFAHYQTQYLDDFEKELVTLFEQEGIYHPFAIYLRDQVKMDVQLIHNTFGFASDRANLSKALRNYIVKNGELGHLPMTDYKRKQILDLHADGKTSREIGRIVNRSGTTVRKVINNR